MSLTPCNNHILYHCQRLVAFATDFDVTIQKQLVGSSGVNGYILKNPIWSCPQFTDYCRRYHGYKHCSRICVLSDSFVVRMIHIICFHKINKSPSIPLPYKTKVICQ
jgi:hypothetical protein